jgi:hypothetical protein
MSKVIVVANENGEVVQKSENNSEYGHIRVEQSRSIIDDRGWLSRKKLVALIPGKVQDLEDADYRDGQELEGKIVVKESIEPFNVKYPERDLKYAGTTGIICKSENNPIYRKAIYTLDMTATDELVEHTNGNEIRKATTPVELKKASAIEPNESFSL